MKKITLKLITVLFVILNATSVSSQCWKEIETGYITSLALKNDGTLWKWGSGTNTPTQMGTDSNWKTISKGADHTLAIKTDGTLWAWGSNTYGQCGNGIFGGNEIANPTQIGTATDWNSVSAGNYHSMAVKTDGTLWALGDNAFGELGIGSTTNQNLPIQVGTATNWKSVSASYYFTLALKTDGTLWAWGIGSHGQLGTGSFGSSNISMQVGTSTNWNVVVAGDYRHSVGIKTDGTLWAWGRNNYGELGDGTTANKNIPTQIGADNDWNFVTSGDESTYAIKTNGTLWGWGYNANGLLGDGTTTDKHIPTQIGINNTWKKVSLHQNHTIALRTDDNLWAWGNNFNGQLGTGNNLSQLTPVAVACPTSLEISDFFTKEFSTFPNPTTGIITISNEDNLTIDKIEILDILGKTVSVKTDNTSQVDISNVANGIYIFKIYSGETIFQKKIIKQ